MKHGSISEIIVYLIHAAKHEEDITVADCLALMGNKSIALALLLLALANSLPVPGIPGFSTVTGIPIIMLGWQLLAGNKTIWLPRRMRAHHMKPAKILIKMEYLLPVLRKMEKFLKPRMLPLSVPPFSNLIGAAVMALGILLALPVPFLNLPMGVTISILAIGLATRDGIVIMAGMLAGAASFTGIFFLLDEGRDLLFW